MLDVARIGGSDKTVGIVEELQDVHPELGAIPYRTINGTFFKTTLRTGRPTTGFRKVGAGLPKSKSTFEERLVECFLLAARIEFDRAADQGHPDGPGTIEAIETVGTVTDAYARFGTQLYYGKNTTYGGNADGFPGLIDYVDPGLVVDAGGTTAATGASVYAIRFSETDVCAVGGNGQIFQMGDFRDETIFDGAGNALPGRVADLMSWIGIQNVSKYNVGRIKKLTADAGKGLTDALGATLLSKFPVAKKPTHWAMSRRSLLQLQLSRTVAIMSAGGNKPDSSSSIVAPVPEFMCNLPIIVTDSLSEVEALTL